MPANAGAEAEGPPTPLIVGEDPVQSLSPQRAHIAPYMPFAANSETSGRSRTLSALLSGNCFCQPGLGYPAWLPSGFTLPRLLAPPPPATILVSPFLSL